ncbi:MAG: hypothetical protein ACHQ9S_00990 [Candidatus Binatia bacterium]
MAAKHEGIKGKRALLRFLQRQGRFSPEGALRLEQLAAPASRSIIEVLEQQGVITERELATSLSRTLRLPLVDLTTFPLSSEVTGVLKGSIATEYEVVPLRLQEGVIEVATANPLDLDAVRAIEFATGRHARVAVATLAEIRDALKRFSAEVPARDQPLTGTDFKEPKSDLCAEVKDAELPPVEIVLTEEVQSNTGTSSVAAELDADSPKVLSGFLAQSAASQDDLSAVVRACCRQVVFLTSSLDAIQLPRPEAAVDSQRIAELQQLVERLQVESRGGRAEVLARADEALQRVEALAASSQACEASTTELVRRLAADCDALGSSVGDVEQRVAALAARPEPLLRAQLRELLDQAHVDCREAQVEAQASSAQATSRADEALARADEAVRRIEALAAALSASTEQTETLGSLRTAVDQLVEERKQLEAECREIKVRVVTLSETALQLSRRVRSIKARLNVVDALRRKVAAAAGAFRLWSVFVADMPIATGGARRLRGGGVAERTHRPALILRRLPDLLLIAGLILVAMLTVYLVTLTRS